jgi:hypothetical protein
MPLVATTLTLSYHEAQVPLVSSLADLDRMLELACEGLSLTPDQLHQELEAGGDMPALASGELAPQAIRLTAEALAVLRYPHAPSNDSDRGARRQQALAMLAQEPAIRYAITTDTELETDAVIVTLAIRDKATCELRIPKDRYDGLALLKVIEEQTGEQNAKA